MSGHHQLAEAMRRHGQTPGYAASNSRIGIISSYDQNTHAVKVQIQPEDVTSNWMPLGAMGVGKGWGIAVGPELGQQVIVVFQEGDFSSGVIVARIFSTDDAAPVVKPGEIAIFHKSGSQLKFNTDGTVNLTSQGTLTTNALQWNHNGPVNINGDVKTTGILTNNNHDVGSSHLHTGVRSGGDKSGPPQ